MSAQSAQLILSEPEPSKQAFDRKQAIYLFAAVRADLPPTVQGVQLCHAIAQASSQGGLTPDTRFVIVSVPDQAALFALASNLDKDRTQFCLFDEPDYDYGPTALATHPGDFRSGRRFSRLALWEVGAAAHVLR
jgi:hypothetical protein